MPSKSKSKGNSAERQVCEFLSKVFNLNHQRVPNSGAYASFSNAFRLKKLTPSQQLLCVGDIIVPEECSSYSYEVKSYRDIPFNLFYTSSELLDKWIIQAREGKRNWFLIMKANNKGFFVCYDRNQGKDYIIPGNFMKYKDCIITKLEGFFEKNKDYMLDNNKRNMIQNETTLRENLSAA